MVAPMQRLLTVPNGLSFARLSLVLVGSSLYLSGHYAVAIGLGALAGITDLIDGPVARKLGQVTRLGAVLDRVGDLFFEGALFFIFCNRGLFHPMFALLYFLREFVVCGIRELAASRGVEIGSSIFGKAKTHAIVYGMLAFALLDSKFVQANEWRYIGYTGMIFGLLLSYYSAFQYMHSLRD